MICAECGAKCRAELGGVGGHTSYFCDKGDRCTMAEHRIDQCAAEDLIRSMKISALRPGSYFSSGQPEQGESNVGRVAGMFVQCLQWWGLCVLEPEVVEDAQANGLTFSWLEDAVFYALLAMGELNDQRVQHATGEQSWMRFPREILRLAVAGDSERVRQLAETYWANPDADDWSSAHVAAVIGDRQRANEFAARIDTHAGSALVLSNLIYVCICGAPFDLEATPNFKARIEEAGFAWPPPSPIKFPAKDW